jgi:hypothetical protein
MKKILAGLAAVTMIAAASAWLHRTHADNLLPSSAEKQTLRDAVQAGQNEGGAALATPTGQDIADYLTNLLAAYPSSLAPKVLLANAEGGNAVAVLLSQPANADNIKKLLNAIPGGDNYFHYWKTLVSAPTDSSSSASLPSSTPQPSLAERVQKSSALKQLQGSQPDDGPAVASQNDDSSSVSVRTGNVTRTANSNGSITTGVRTGNVTTTTGPGGGITTSVKTGDVITTTSPDGAITTSQQVGNTIITHNSRQYHHKSKGREHDRHK